MTGLLVLFGSGETSPSGQKIFDSLFRQLPPSPRVALLETPAGFELNSPQVAGRVADFLRRRLQNYHPQIEIIPARKRGTPHSPNNPQIAAALLHADLIFAGAGSPTYTVRQLRGSRLWYTLLARHRLGSALAFASATVIAVGAWALPVYEIYKVGEDPHWKPGLNLLENFGLTPVFVPHWNNNDGGAELDTSRCFMGRARFSALLEMLPPKHPVIGIDEHTALRLDCAAHRCKVQGRGTVTVIRDGRPQIFSSGEEFALSEIGECRPPAPGEGIPPEIWRGVLESAGHPSPEAAPVPPEIVLSLVEQRAAARARRDWPAADALRARIESLGWKVQDTPAGPQLTQKT